MLSSLRQCGHLYSDSILLEIVIYLADSTKLHEAEEAPSGISGMELIMNEAQTMELSCCTLRLIHFFKALLLLTKFDILSHEWML